MDVSSYVLLSHEQALRRRLDVVANNMANVNTTGFKREQPVFHELVETSDGTMPAARSVSFVLDYGATHDVREGAFQATGNPLDVAIQGPGYLSVALPDGSTAYTRAGNLRVLPDGRLGTASGTPVLGEDGAPIAVPADAGAQLRIAEDGTVFGTAGPFGRLGVSMFDDEGSVTVRGDGLVTGTGARLLPAADTRLKSGGLEASNVEPIVETTHMIEILRSYQSSQRMSEGINDMRRRAIERLGRLGN
jgi:flagellar basal-body rod protein FlgF